MQMLVALEIVCVCVCRGEGRRGRGGGRCGCMCILHIFMLEPLLMCTLCASFVKLRITCSISMYIICYIEFVQRFEPRGRRFIISPYYHYY